MRRLMLLVGAVAVVASCAVLATGASGSAGSGQARWVITDLGTLGGKASYASASAVNERGQVVGESATSAKSGYYPFFWQNGKMRAVGSLGGR